MTDSIGSLLTQREFFEPPEIAIIQKFISDKFSVMPKVTIRSDDIVISVTGSALAGALRPELPKLREACNTQKRLVLRIE